MKDDAQDSHTPDSLPPCPMSNQCLHFVDELSGRVPQSGSTSEDAQNEKMLEQLRVHALTCPTCTATLAKANNVLTQQRRVLRAILDEGEQKVPSTTAHIMATLRQGQRTPQKTLVSAHNHHREVLPVVPFPQVREIETPRPRQTRQHTLRNTLAIAAVAAVLVASFGLFSYVLPHHSSSSSTARSSIATVTKATPFIPGTTPTWSSVIITYKINGITIIANYDPITEKSVMLTSSPYVDTLVDGVSHDGQKLLFSTYDGLKTSYYLYPQATTDAIFTTPDKSSSAIWSTDNRYVFISTAKGIAQVDTQTHDVRLILPALAATKLLNYRDGGYLYFVKGYEGQAYASEGTFNRVNIAQGTVQQITPCEHGTNFWLSPGGITVYYNCPDQDTTVLYAVNSDGTNPHAFSFNAGTVIGYAEEGSPLTLVNASGKYQVVQRDVNTAQAKVVLEDVAPGATTMTADDIAVAPFGHTLVAKGVYGGSGAAPQERFWYGDLVAGKSRAFALPQGAVTPNAIGWDKLQVVTGAPSPSPTP
ncbi:MAG: hypothetical protein NVS4B11_07030 [Ktedonobacteraceae bacterium]